MLSLSVDERNGKNGKVRDISLETLLEDKHIMRYLGKWGLLRQNIFGQYAWAYLGRLNPSEPAYHHGREFDELHDAGLNYRSPALPQDEKARLRGIALRNIEDDELEPKQQLFQAFLANYMDNVDILNDLIRAKKGRGFPEDSRSLQYNEQVVENMLQFIWEHHNQDTPERQDGLLYVTHPVRVAYIGQVFTIFSYYPEIKDEERALLVKDFLLDTLTFLGHDLLETTRLGSQDEEDVVKTFNADIFHADVPHSELGVSQGKILYDNLMSVSKIKSHTSGADTWVYDLLRSYQRYFSGENGSLDLRGRMAPIITRQADCADNVFTLSHKGKAFGRAIVRKRPLQG